MDDLTVMTPIRNRIKRMNEVFGLPVPLRLTNHGDERLKAFHKVLSEECDEILDSIDDNGNPDFVALADVLADIVVYAYSEAARWGIPLDRVVHLVLNSQDSKLVDGKAVMSEDGSKFIKGPNYQPPEPLIRELLKHFK